MKKGKEEKEKKKSASNICSYCRARRVHVALMTYECFNRDDKGLWWRATITAESIEVDQWHYLPPLNPLS